MSETEANSKLNLAEPVFHLCAVHGNCDSCVEATCYCIHNFYSGQCLDAVKIKLNDPVLKVTFPRMYELALKVHKECPSQTLNKVTSDKPLGKSIEMLLLDEPVVQVCTVHGSCCSCSSQAACQCHHRSLVFQPLCPWKQTLKLSDEVLKEEYPQTYEWLLNKYRKDCEKERILIERLFEKSDDEFFSDSKETASASQVAKQVVIEPLEHDSDYIIARENPPFDSTDPCYANQLAVPEYAFLYSLLNGTEEGSNKDILTTPSEERSNDNKICSKRSKY